MRTIDTFDVIILGAGIVGAACARECALAGMRVAIVERAVPAGGASAAGMGHLVAMDDSPAQLALSHYSRELWRALKSELPSSVEYEECGTLWVAADAEEMIEVFRKQQIYSRSGIASEVLDELALREAEPNLRSGLAGALMVANDGGYSAVRAAHGEVALESGMELRAGHIILATGTDIRLCPWLEVQPRKGHLAITDRYPGILRHQLVELGYLKSAHNLDADSVAFNLQPRKTGQVLIGSSRQYGDLSVKADANILRRMLDRAVEYMPSMRSLSVVRVWTGFRAATPDKLPLIGPSPDPSVLLAMGFEGLGITNAPGAARMVLHHLTGAAPPLDPNPFLPSRTRASEALYA